MIFLSNEHITLRPLERTDLTAAYVQWLNDAEVCRHNSHAIFPYTREKMEAYFEHLQANARNTIVLAMIHPGDKTHVGNISLQAIDWVVRSAELAILLGERNHWGKGLATQAAGLLCDYGFSRLNLNRIYCGTSAANTGMQRLASRLNMTKEGVRRQALYKNGEYVDVVEYGLLRKEFLFPQSVHEAG